MTITEEEEAQLIRECAMRWFVAGGEDALRTAAHAHTIYTDAIEEVANRAWDRARIFVGADKRV
jgi:hypothetical protein